MTNFGHISLLIFTILPSSCGFYIDGCPLYGCRPSGTFAYQLNVPINATIAWVSNFFVGPLPKGQGCVGNLENLVCQSNGPGPLDVGYVAINADEGYELWRNGYLRFPTLPVMDSDGNVFGTDGDSLTLNDADGHLEPVINLKPTLRPVFNMETADDDFLLIVSEQGDITVWQTNGVPVTSTYLKGTEQGIQGTFIPIATPAVNGSRAYILTQFVPDTGQMVKPGLFEMRRLYAIDIFDRMVEQLVIAWYFNFERLNPKVGQTDEILKFMEDDTMVPNLLYDYETGTVFVTMPATTESASERNISQSINSFWAIKDTGDAANLVFLKFMSILSIAKYEANDDMSKKLDFDGLKRKSWNDTKPRVSKGYLWAAAPGGVIYGFNPANGEMVKAINITDALKVEAVTITSKLMVARRNDTSSDILIFGIGVSEATEAFREFVSVGFSNLSTQHFLVAYDTSTTMDKILWMIPTPQNTEINGQIVGIPRSADKYRNSTNQGQNDQRDLLVAFTQMKGNFTTFFAVH
ncbi:hypothetical protein ACJMK2_026100 [Sinanodonta woodiana]|uniref:Uncharacterized protein n=1 Tax=Sinanodonta woodiana TaxID=1069815 RepID=A0ABD3XJ19_SINWO